MSRLTAVITLLAVSLLSPAIPTECATAMGEEQALAENLTATDAPCHSFNRLNTLVRDGRIGRVAARQELRRLIPAITSYYYANGGTDHDRSEWVFPLAGYSTGAVAGGRRHGYQPRGYDWYDGNQHGGHPAVDIFIRDRNRDDLDDRTGAPVQVVSMTGGVVVALENDWPPKSKLRGGKYLWIYDPSNGSLVYYAHNRELAVGLGDIVSPGDPIAIVGRTGLNAAKKRSPTHLHLTILSIGSDGALVPEDPYPVLHRSETRGDVQR